MVYHLKRGPIFLLNYRHIPHRVIHAVLEQTCVLHGSSLHIYSCYSADARTYLLVVQVVHVTPSHPPLLQVNTVLLILETSC